ncbi:hypothetical protein OF83DRAFT_1120269 [Amylostereum chailletii]|nr:hypothetical protein OF83DRAFT_1120269 [Amylostereum chailletii]
MRRTPSEFNFSIVGDEQEQNRIRLEHNLQQTDLSIHLSSTHDDDDDDYSIEYPRHNSGPTPSFSAFRSMEHSREDFDPEEGISHLNAWSFRTGDDDEGVTHYVGGETLSTAAHHASALTLSAGLGGRGARRDISLSGAEYDPDRPLQDLVANYNSKLSMFDGDNTRSRYQPPAVPFDPHVAEADSIFSSREARAAASRVRSPKSGQSSSSSSSELETPDSSSARPKLSDALSHLTFSPKRPRSPTIPRASSPALTHSRSHRSRTSNNIQQHVSPPSRAHSQFPTVHEEDGGPTPRPSRTQKQTASSRAPPPSRPEIKVRPPTPSTANSKFTKMARGLARELQEQEEEGRWQAPDMAGLQGDGFAMPMQSTLKTKQPKTGHGNLSYSMNGKSFALPDITGLTAAVESPAKAGLRYRPYENDGITDGQAHLIKTFGLVQQRLAHLEAENGTSRRRMQELEFELDACKAEVALERERVMQREEAISQHRYQMQRHVEAAQKGKARAQADGEEDQRRYKEAVEEKKALEALIATLRSHMSRLTGELASHQALLDELRSLRETDSATLHEKVREVDRLRNEVEKVAGEVEVLKGVVEEGLRERRMRHDRSRMSEEEITQRQPESDHEEDTEEEVGHADQDTEREDEGEDMFVERDTRDDSLYASRDIQMTAPQGHSSPRLGTYPDRTMRTDRATIDTSPAAGSSTRRFIDESEVERISQELEERRSERSGSRSASRLGNSLSRSQSSTHSRSSHRSASIASSVSGSERGSSRSNSRLGAFVEDAPPRARSRAGTPDLASASQKLRRHVSSPPEMQAQAGPRPPAPTPAHASGQTGVAEVSTPYPSQRTQKRGKAAEPAVVETPFPQIRGARLERLFFSAPEHNVKTCTVCRRRRRPEAGAESLKRPLWYPPTKERKTRGHDEDDEEDDDDEGFEEGSEDMMNPPEAGPSKGKGKMTDGVGAGNLDFLTPGTPKDRLPPQTVLVRVLRELEDDFTHYKGIYLELAHQYGLMDPASNVVKRNVLAEHLREVIDVLEQRGDQIASLYDLLTFEDKPTAGAGPSQSKPAPFSGRPRPTSKKQTAFA